MHQNYSLPKFKGGLKNLRVILQKKFNCENNLPALSLKNLFVAKSKYMTGFIESTNFGSDPRYPSNLTSFTPTIYYITLIQYIIYTVNQKAICSVLQVYLI